MRSNNSNSSRRLQLPLLAPCCRCCHVLASGLLARSLLGLDAVPLHSSAGRPTGHCVACALSCCVCWSVGQPWCGRHAGSTRRRPSIRAGQQVSWRLQDAAYGIPGLHKGSCWDRLMLQNYSLMHAHRTCSQYTSSSRAAWGLHSVGVTLRVPAAPLVNGCLAALLTCHPLTAGLCGSRLEVAVRHRPAFKVYVYTHCRSLTELASVCSALIVR
jgi:hypothetical protein